MKSQAQVVMLVVAFVVLIGGIAFVRNWIYTKPDDGAEETKTPEVAALDFPVKIAEGHPEYEVHTDGHHDFSFQNPNPQAIELGLDRTSCTCSHVGVRTLTPEEANVVRQECLGGAVPVLEGSAGLLPTLASLAGLLHLAPRLADQPDRWQALKDAKSGQVESVVSVPSHGVGLVRLSWQGRQVGPQRLSATVWVQAAGNSHSRGGRTTLEVPVLFVNPVQVYPETVPSVTLEPNGHHQFECLCWSSTRPDFQLLSVREEDNNPCFVCTFVRLTGAELNQAATTLSKQVPVRVLSAYRIFVKLYERLPSKGAQLDLGPFKHHLVLKTNQADFETLTVTVPGTVRGDITVGAGESRDKIRLPTFPASRGTTATVPIQANHPGLKLVIDSHKPEYLGVELREHPGEEGRRWDLTVTVPPGRAAGEMPPESAVVLKTQTQPPRLIRIPVLGRAKLQ
jgi:hypothetical protein